MNECLNIYELIQKELDGDLTSEERLELSTHCQWCFHCQSLREEYQGIDMQLFNLPLLDPGDDFLAGVMARVDRPLAKSKDFQLSNLNSLVAAIAFFLVSGIFVVGWLVILPILGLSIYLFNQFWPITYLYSGLVSAYNFLNVSGSIISNTTQIITPQIMVLIICISFASFIVLLRMMLTTKEEYHV